MLKYLFYLFVALVSYSILAYVYAGPSRGAPPVTDKATKETFFADENSADLIKELSTMASRLSVISSKLAAKPRAGSNDGHEESNDSKKEKEPFKEEENANDADDEDKGSKKKAKDADADDEDKGSKKKAEAADEDSKKKDKDDDEDKGSKKKAAAAAEKSSSSSKKDDDTAMLNSMRAVMQQPPLPPKAEGFSNYDGVESVKFSNYMLL